MDDRFSEFTTELFTYFEYEIDESASNIFENPNYMEIVSDLDNIGTGEDFCYTKLLNDMCKIYCAYSIREYLSAASYFSEKNFEKAIFSITQGTYWLGSAHEWNVSTRYYLDDLYSFSKGPAIKKRKSIDKWDKVRQEFYNQMKSFPNHFVGENRRTACERTGMKRIPSDRTLERQLPWPPK